MSDNNNEHVEIQITVDFGEYSSLEEPQRSIRELDVIRGASKAVTKHIEYLVELHHTGYIRDLSEVSEMILLLSRVSLGFTEEAEFLSNDLYLRLKKDVLDAEVIDA